MAKSAQATKESFQDSINVDVNLYKRLRDKQVSEWRKPRNMIEFKENNPDD
jgi:hypothetical protein